MLLAAQAVRTRPELPPPCTLPTNSALLHASTTAGMRQALPGAVVSPAGGRQRLRSTAFAAAAAPSPPALIQTSSPCLTPLPAGGCVITTGLRAASEVGCGGLLKLFFQKGGAQPAHRFNHPRRCRQGRARHRAAALPALLRGAAQAGEVSLSAHSSSNRHMYRCTDEPALDTAAPDLRACSPSAP